MKKEGIGKKVKEDYEFTILYDVYDEVIIDDQISYKLLKKDCKKKWYVSELYNITDVREVPSKKVGVNYINRCEIFHRPEGKWITVQGSLKEIKDLLKQDRIKIIGFKKWK